MNKIFIVILIKLVYNMLIWDTWQSKLILLFF